jgi:hypothetical protein
MVGPQLPSMSVPYCTGLSWANPGVLISGDHNKSSESIDVAEGKVKLTFLSHSNIVRGVLRGVFRVEQIVVTRAV